MVKLTYFPSRSTKSSLQNGEKTEGKIWASFLDENAHIQLHVVFIHVAFLYTIFFFFFPLDVACLYFPFLDVAYLFFFFSFSFLFYLFIFFFLLIYWAGVASLFFSFFFFFFFIFFSFDLLGRFVQYSFLFFFLHFFWVFFFRCDFFYENDFYFLINLGDWYFFWLFITFFVLIGHHFLIRVYA